MQFCFDAKGIIAVLLLQILERGPPQALLSPMLPSCQRTLRQVNIFQVANAGQSVVNSGAGNSLPAADKGRTGDRERKEMNSGSD